MAGDMAATLAVGDHYGRRSLWGRVQDALIAEGLSGDALSWQQLAVLDQFHVRGLAATRELADGLALTAASRVLDVGCGLGGPARCLAATTGCHVTGIDLSQPFIEVAAALGLACGLADRLDFRQADALALPFADATFDHAITQHVAMNIADRRTFLTGIHRVLKSGGRLGVYDVVAIDGQQPDYPLPWARDSAISFLQTAQQMAGSVTDAGFEVLSFDDKTAEALSWFSRQSGRTPGRLGLALVMGPDFPAMTANLKKNLGEGRLGLVQALLRRR
jgi:ubiquinone/menaquinone biosynthesis C-methylase UbiE